MKRLAAILLGMALVIGACGGDSSTATSSSTDGEPADDSSQPQSTDGSEASDTPSAPIATVTIDDENFKFSHDFTSNCRANDGGAFKANLLLVDENGELVVGSDLDLTLLHEGTAPDTVTNNSILVYFLDLEDPSAPTTGWEADAARAEQYGYPPGASQVDSYVIDGQTASGTATFVDRKSSTAFLRGEIDTVQSVQGTFTVTCGG